MRNVTKLTSWTRFTCLKTIKVPYRYIKQINKNKGGKNLFITEKQILLIRLTNYTVHTSFAKLLDSLLSFSEL